VTFPVEIGRRLDLQLGSLDIAVDATAAFQLKQVLYFDSTGDLAHDVSLSTDDIAFHDTIGADDDFRRAVDVTHQVPIDAQVPVAGNISFHRSSGPDKAGAGACRRIGSYEVLCFGFSIEHSIRF